MKLVISSLKEGRFFQAIPTICQLFIWLRRIVVALNIRILLYQNWRSMKDGPGRKVNRLIYFDFRSIKFVSDEQKQALKAAKICTDEQLTGNCINIALFRAYIEAYLLSKPEVCKETTVLVRQVEATQCGLPLEVVFFIKNSPEIHYEHTLANIMAQQLTSDSPFINNIPNNNKVVVC